MAKGAISPASAEAAAKLAAAGIPPEWAAAHGTRLIDALNDRGLRPDEALGLVSAADNVVDLVSQGAAVACPCGQASRTW